MVAYWWVGWMVWVEWGRTHSDGAELNQYGPMFAQHKNHAERKLTLTRNKTKVFPQSNLEPF